MGAIRRKIEVNKGSAEAFELFTTLLTSLGKLKEVNKDQMKIQGRMKFGLQSVPVKIKIHAVSSDTTIVEILTWSDDFWSYAAKDSIARILKLYSYPTKQIEQKDLLGMIPIYLALIITGFYWLLRYFVIPMTETNNLWDYAFVFGTVVIIYFIISRIRFSYM